MALAAVRGHPTQPTYFLPSSEIVTEHHMDPGGSEDRQQQMLPRLYQKPVVITLTVPVFPFLSLRFLKSCNWASLETALGICLQIPDVRESMDSWIFLSQSTLNWMAGERSSLVSLLQVGKFAHFILQGPHAGLGGGGLLTSSSCPFSPTTLPQHHCKIPRSEPALGRLGVRQIPVAHSSGTVEQAI